MWCVALRDNTPYPYLYLMCVHSRNAIASLMRVRYRKSQCTFIILAAERGTEKIAVEIKSFLGDSELFEYHAALGQFLNYRLAL